MEQPLSFVILSSKGKFYKLKNELYRLKQSPHVWYQWIDSYFLKIGFKRSPSNANLYIYKEGGKCMIMVLYVDDPVMMGNHEEIISQTKQMLGREFEMTDLGLMHFYFGREIWQQPNQIFISQQKYARKILKAFGMTNCKSVGTPMEINVKLSTEDSLPLIDEAKYTRLLGSLIYLCNT